MKKFLLVASLFLGTWSASAQSPYVAVEGVTANDRGLAYNLPKTTLAVDLTEVTEYTLAGPYARYALKYLGLRAPFSDKKNHSLHAAELALFSATEYEARPVAEPVTEPVLQGDSPEAFASLTIDRIESNLLSDESAAQSAANRIFQLRRARLDLITGEAGEHVFGEGLKSALAEIDRQEQELLALFLGKRYRTTHTHRLLVNPEADKRQYILCRFSESDGVLSANDLSGEIVLLEITPGEPFAVEEAPLKATDVVKCRVAAPSLCAVQYAGAELGSRTLPLFEFGHTVRVVAPRKK